MSGMPSATALPTLIVLVFGLHSLACNEPPSSAGSTGVDTVVLEQVTDIGQVFGADEYEFGEIGGVAVDEAGRIYVSDRMTSEVRAYGRDGVFLGLIAREGEGPGELSQPSDPFFDSQGRLWIRDRVRVTVLERTEPQGLPDSVAQTRPFPGLTWYAASARSRLIGNTYFYPGYAGIFREHEPDRYFYAGLDGTGPANDTIEVPQYGNLKSLAPAFFRISRSTGRVVPSLSLAPFEPRPSWELTAAGTILGGSGESMILETDRRGDTIRIIRVQSRRAVSSEERADSLAALNSRIDSLEVPLERVGNVSARVRNGDLHDSVPGFIAVHTSQEGKIWVRRWPLAGKDTHSFFDVYDREGQYERTVVVPEVVLPSPPPFIGRGSLVGVTQDGGTGVQGVVVYRVPPS